VFQLESCQVELVETGKISYVIRLRQAQADSSLLSIETERLPDSKKIKGMTYGSSLF